MTQANRSSSARLPIGRPRRAAARSFRSASSPPCRRCGRDCSRRASSSPCGARAEADGTPTAGIFCSRAVEPDQGAAMIVAMKKSSAPLAASTPRSSARVDEPPQDADAAGSAADDGSARCETRRGSGRAIRRSRPSCRSPSRPVAMNGAGRHAVDSAISATSPRRRRKGKAVAGRHRRACNRPRNRPGDGSVAAHIDIVIAGHDGDVARRCRASASQIAGALGIRSAARN